MAKRIKTLTGDHYEAGGIQTDQERDDDLDEMDVEDNQN